MNILDRLTESFSLWAKNVFQKKELKERNDRINTFTNKLIFAMEPGRREREQMLPVFKKEELMAVLRENLGYFFLHEKFMPFSPREKDLLYVPEKNHHFLYERSGPDWVPIARMDDALKEKVKIVWAKSTDATEFLRLLEMEIFIPNPDKADTRKNINEKLSAWNI